jgi:hypothetical protein
MLFSVAIVVLLLVLWLGVAFSSGMLASRSRKFAYAGGILILFFAMLFHRRDEVEEAAKRHDLRETDLGQVDLGGSTARFVLTSFRGPLICLLWWDSTERFARHEFQEVELRYRALTKLQPHFRSPWQYQAHNLAYNMSVEFDRVEDKYFWISQGIRWAALGEATNRRRIYDESSPGNRRVLGDPDMRQYVGFMLQDKMSVSDEVNTHRCFLHLSCIPPSQWDPSELRRSPERFEDFKKTYPQFVRQVRLLRNIPEGADKQVDNELIAFFRAHRRLPSLYGEESNPAADSVGQQFPVWPDRLRPSNPELEDNHDPFEIARTWYEFAQEPLPPPLFDPEEDPARMRLYRLPRQMMSIIFRKLPAQAKALQGKQLGKDGWFEQSQKCWKQALDMWIAFGRQNALEMSPEEYDERFRRAQSFHNRFPEEARLGRMPPTMYRQDQEIMRSYYDFVALRDITDRRQRANYHHWRTVAQTESTDEAIAARRSVYFAQASRSDLKLALREFEAGLQGWKGLLIKPRKLQPGSNDIVFLTAFGPHSGMPANFALQSMDLFSHTEFGKDMVMNDEIVETQDQYLLLRARSNAAALLRGQFAAWQAASLAGHLAGLPQGPSPFVPVSQAPLSLDAAERFLFFDSGPLDLYVLPESLGKSARYKPPERPDAPRRQEDVVRPSPPQIR